MLEGVDTWYVRLAEDDPGNPSARVVVEVIDPNGQPAPALAVNMRQRADGDGMLSRSPTPEEFDFLKALRKEKGYGRASWCGRKRIGPMSESRDAARLR